MPKKRLAGICKDEVCANILPMVLGKSSRIKFVLKKQKKKKTKMLDSKQHPDHSNELPRLRRMMGQLEALERMIVERRYCLDIIQQLRAANSAGKALELEILKGHLSTCIKTAAQSKSPRAFNEKLNELLDLIRG
jgi:DNA-binding FrmR family transcriptional regulator